MKKLFIPLLALIPFSAQAAWWNHFTWFTNDVVLGGPVYRIERTILPETDSTYELGTTTREWMRIFTDSLTVTGAGGSGTRCLQVNNDGVVSKAASACGTGGGGGGSDVNWTFFNESGLYPSTTTNSVLIGDSSTSTRAALEVKAISAAWGAISAIGSTTLQNFTFTTATGTSATTTNFAISSLTSELLKVDGSGRVLEAVSGTDYEVPITFGDGLTRTANDIDVDTTQNITNLSNLTSNGFVKTSGGNGTLSIDTNTYLTGNQTITLSGDVSGSGETAITTTIGNGKVTNAMLAGSIAASKLVGTDIATVGTITSGTWQGTAIADAYITKTGAWTGTFDGQEGTYYLDRTNHTGTQLASTITGATFGSGAFVFPSGSLSSLGSTTLQNFTFDNATGTNATSSNLVLSDSLRLSWLNCAANSNGGTLTTDANGFLTCSDDDSSAGGGSYPFAGANNSTTTLTQFNGGLTAFASSTIGGGNNSNGLTIWGKATTTNLLITSLTSELLKVDASGNVLEAVSGTDYSNFGASVGPTELESADFGSFTCNGTTCTIDNGAVSNAMLANSSVSYGGVSVALGASDATPAFNLADATGLPISTGVSGLGTGIATWLATPSSANLASALTDETGSGVAVFGTNPSIAGATLTGVIDGGGATSFEIPNGAAPTVDAAGEIAVDTTSDQLIYYGGAQRVVSYAIDGNFLYSTSTMGTGTTTLKTAGFKQPSSIVSLGCSVTGTGSFTAQFGDGSASSTFVVSGTGNTTSYTTISANNSFTAGEAVYWAIGSVSGSVANPTCSYQRVITAD